MVFGIRKWPAIFSLAALVCCGRVLVIVPESGIKAVAASELRQAESFLMISQQQRHTHTHTQTHIQTHTQTHTFTQKKNSVTVQQR